MLVAKNQKLGSQPADFGTAAASLSCKLKYVTVFKSTNYRCAKQPLAKSALRVSHKFTQKPIFSMVV